MRACLTCGAEALAKSGEVPGDNVWYRDRSMRELHRRAHAAYRWTYRRMVVAVQRHIEEKILGEPLFKAGGKPPPLRPLTPAELETLRTIIQSHHDAFSVHVTGAGALDPVVVQQLIREGLLTPDGRLAGGDAPERLAMIDENFRYGRAIGGGDMSQRKSTEDLTFAEWKRQPVLPLSEAEEYALDFARHSAATRIRGLGNRIADDFTTEAIEADRQLRRKFEATVHDEVAAGIEKRTSWRKVWSELGHATGDWSRDFGRIAATEGLDAMIEGQARAIRDRTGDDPEEIRVAKQPNPDACEACRQLYTVGGIPRVFTLAELTANGSNAGRKRKDWLATLGPIHPWCFCTLIEVPSGWGFDEEGDLAPLVLKRADLAWNLRKSATRRQHVMLYGTPGGGITIRVGDPFVRVAVEEVVSRTPVDVFTRATGVTLITTDHGRPLNPLEANDYAYWAGNEIRLQQTIDPKKVKRVLEHEIGHSLNSWVFSKRGSVEAVRAWHDELWGISQREGFVSLYAKKEPIENAAEVSRLYLYHRADLRRSYPSQFSACHRMYSDMAATTKRAS